MTVQWRDLARKIDPPDDGSLLRRLRIWNIRNHFAITWAVWILIAAILWRIC